MITREKKPPKSYDVLSTVLVYGDSKELARRFSCSEQVITAYCRPYEDGNNNSGKLSFLDRCREVISMVKEDDNSPDRAYPIGHYIANHLGGTFVPDLQLSTDPDNDVLSCISQILQDAGSTIDATRQYWFEETPGRFTPKEQAALNQEINAAISALVQLRHVMRQR